MRRFLRLVTVLLVGCEPVLGIGLEGTRGNLKISLRNCKNGEKLGVNHISVIDGLGVELGQAAHEVCELRPPAGPVNAITDWQYGTRPPGYAVLGCAPLTSGPVYTVVISRPYGARRFRLTNDDSIQPLDPVCPP